MINQFQAARQRVNNNNNSTASKVIQGHSKLWYRYTLATKKEVLQNHRRVTTTSSTAWNFNQSINSRNINHHKHIQHQFLQLAIRHEINPFFTPGRRSNIQAAGSNNPIIENGNIRFRKRYRPACFYPQSNRIDLLVVHHHSVTSTSSSRCCDVVSTKIFKSAICRPDVSTSCPMKLRWQFVEFERVINQ